MLGKAVLATLVYYDVLEYPMTEFEIWKHLIAPREYDVQKTYSLGEVSEAVDRLCREGKLIRFSGFVMLPGRKDLVVDRIREEKQSVAKIKRAARLAHVLAWVPFLRMIGLTGSLSMKKGDAHSDWDFFVVLASGAIWRGRTVLSLVLQLLGKRRHGKHVENRACLNHFVTDKSLEIAMKDFFSAHEYRFLYPLTGWDTFRRFELANRWMTEIKPNFQLTEIAPLWVGETSRLQQFFQRLGERFLSSHFLEKWLARWQKEKIQRNPKTALPGGFIVASDEALIFLPHPKGPKIFERFKEKLSFFGLSVPTV